jgi:hypothetical protein
VHSYKTNSCGHPLFGYIGIFFQFYIPLGMHLIRYIDFEKLW